jgi:hypothetical protein
MRRVAEALLHVYRTLLPRAEAGWWDNTCRPVRTLIQLGMERRFRYGVKLA